MPRAYWKGYLRLSLVTCQIELFPATSQAEKTNFHQINTQTGHRLRQQMVDEETGRVVDAEHKGRGYELTKGKYVEIDEDELVRFRCHVGHTYTAEVMSLALDENLRRALASALRALEERVALARKLHKQAVDGSHQLLAEHWADRAREFEQEMDVLRNSVRRMERLAADSERSANAAAE